MIIERRILSQSAWAGVDHPHWHHAYSLSFALGLVPEIFLARLQAGCGCCRVVVCFELGKTNEVRMSLRVCEAISCQAEIASELAMTLGFNSFQESRCIQFTFEQIGEIALHQSLRFFLDLKAGTRT